MRNRNVGPGVGKRVLGWWCALVIVEVDASATDRLATDERVARRLRHDDPAILAMRSQGYAATKAGLPLLRP